MLIPQKIKVAAAVVVLAAGAAGLVYTGWNIRGVRADADIASLKLAHSNERLDAASQTVRDLVEIRKGMQDAMQNFNTAAQNNAAAQQSLDASLRDFRSLTGGLRADFASLPGFIERANKSSLGEYAAACTAIFENMAGEIGKLSEAGAGIARQAEGHAADAKLMRESWPKKKSATKD